MNKYLDSLKVGNSPLVDTWFMMSSPKPILYVVLVYLIMVRIGPRIMRNRPPLKLTNVIGYYNAVQVILSVMICYKTLKLPHLFRDGILYTGCRYSATSQTYQLLDVGWWYCFAKFTELLDTLFFVLRKKESQVTFLHVYHHTIMALYSWTYLKFDAGGEGAILGFLNSFVHIIMYTYYFMAGLGPKFQKYLWWKKYVTTIQLFQFVIMLSYCALTHFSPKCQNTPGFTYFISTNVIIFMCLFIKFYSKSYKRERSAEKEIKEEFEKTRNGMRNGAKNGSCGIKENGNCENCKSLTNLEEIPYEVIRPCGSYAKNSDLFTKRSTKDAYNYTSIVPK